MKYKNEKEEEITKDILCIFGIKPEQFEQIEEIKYWDSICCTGVLGDICRYMEHLDIQQDRLSQKLKESFKLIEKEVHPECEFELCNDGWVRTLKKTFKTQDEARSEWKKIVFCLRDRNPLWYKDYKLPESSTEKKEELDKQYLSMKIDEFVKVTHLNSDIDPYTRYSKISRSDNRYIYETCSGYQFILDGNQIMFTHESKEKNYGSTWCWTYLV